MGYLLVGQTAPRALRQRLEVREGFLQERGGSEPAGRGAEEGGIEIEACGGECG